MAAGSVRNALAHALLSIVGSLLAIVASVAAVHAADLGLRPIRSVRIGGDFAVPIPLDDLFYWYDDFGASLASIGDFDGDGMSDIVVGAPDERFAGFAGPGNVIAIFLESDGGVKDALAIGGYDGTGIGQSRASGDRFGAALASLGDLDGNGVIDLVVGAPGSDLTATDEGAVHVLFLDEDGGVIDERKITSGLAGFDAVLDAYDEFGAAVAVAPGATVGFAEIFVGAPQRNAGVGRAFALELNASGQVVAETEIRADDDAIAATGAAGIAFGGAIAVPGDIDGNAVHDLVVGSPDFGDSDEGSAWVLLRSAAGGVQSSVRIGSLSGGFGASLQSGARFGSAVAGFDDTDENGVPDVLVAAPGTGFPIGGGRVWALLLSSAGTVLDVREFDHESFCEPLPVLVGSALASLGDLDGNGIPDFAIGNAYDFEGFPGTTTTTVVCTTYVTTSTSTTTALMDASLDGALIASPVCDGGASHAPAKRVCARDTTPQRCFRPDGTGICGRPKYRRCGDNHVRLVFLDENADIATCGDGVRDEGEVCDDGNTEDGDCCTADCLTAPLDNECHFDGNPCNEHRCDGNGGCESRAIGVGHACVDHFGCVEAGTCSAAGRCVDPSTTVSVCRADDGGCYRCGQPVSASGHPRATDALYILHVAVGFLECELCICDVDSNGIVSAADALAALFRVVEVVPANPVCPHR